VLDDDRQKLSKRKGAVACDVFKNEGYLPEAMNNYLALLGWSHPEGKEIFNLNEMENLFSVDRLNASGAVFDRVKLKWVNSQHLRALSSEDLWALISAQLAKTDLVLPQDPVWRMRSVEVFRSKLEVASDAIQLYTPLDESKFIISDEAKEVFEWPTTSIVLEAWKKLLSDFKGDCLAEADFVRIENEVKILSATKGKNLFMPMRIAVIGKPHGTELKILTPLILVKSLIDRADLVLAKLKG
jgi:nondiscriminating glutamyl-tRNA synthetase